MKRWIAFLLIAGLAWQLPAQAQPRPYSQAELDALLAPVALYPDPVLSHVLVAATYPDEVREAAAWSRANPHLSGETAVQAADAMPWHPSVKALLAFPDLLARMDESPQWTADLGMAFREQEPYVMDTVQALRRRAQASGNLQSNAHQQVYDQGDAIVVYPAQPQVVYVPYYDPYAVYGPWPWHPYRPVYWQPWHARPAVFVSSHVFFVRSVDWRRRHVVRHVVHHHHRAPAALQQHANRPQGAHWRSDHSARREVHRPRSQPAAPVTIRNHAHPVRPIVEPVGIRPLPVNPPVHRPLRPIGEPVRPIGEPVRPIVDSVRLHSIERRIETVRAPWQAHSIYRQANPAAHRPHVEQRREQRPAGRQESRQHQNRRG